MTAITEIQNNKNPNELKELRVLIPVYLHNVVSAEAKLLGCKTTSEYVTKLLTQRKVIIKAKS